MCALWAKPPGGGPVCQPACRGRAHPSPLRRSGGSGHVSRAVAALPMGGRTAIS